MAETMWASNPGRVAAAALGSYCIMKSLRTVTLSWTAPRRFTSPSAFGAHAYDRVPWGFEAGGGVGDLENGHNGHRAITILKS